MAGTAVYSANQQKKAAEEQARAAQYGIDASNAANAQARADQAHFIEASKWALPQLQATFDGDYSGFYDSPDYLATQEQGLSFMDRSAAARGGLYSGGHSADLMKYGQGLAAQQLGNYRGGLAQLAGLGQSSAQSVGGFGMQNAGNLANLYGNRASAYGQRADANSQMAGALGGIFNNYAQGWGAARVPSTGASNYQWASTSGFGNNYGSNPYTANTLSGNGLNNSWWNS